MQFTRIRKSLLLLEFTFCSEDPGKKVGFAMWPLGRLAGAGEPIPASSPTLAAGERLGRVLRGTRG
jgi:hypothetical protein